MQRLLQENRTKQAGVHVCGGGRLRNYEGAEEQVSILPIQEMHRTGYGPTGGSGGPDAWRQEFWCSVQSLQGMNVRMLNYNYFHNVETKTPFCQLVSRSANSSIFQTQIRRA